MLAIDTNGNIRVNRGDVFQMPLFIDISTNLFYSMRFKFHEGDILQFHIMEPNQPFSKALIKKEFTIDDLNEYGDILINFDHEDTCWMIPNTYFYEVKLIRTVEEEKKVITIVSRRKFVIQ